MWEVGGLLGKCERGGWIWPFIFHPITRQKGVKHGVWMGPGELQGGATLSPHWKWSVCWLRGGGEGQCCSEWMVRGMHRKPHLEGD